MSEPTVPPQREISLLAIWAFLWRHVMLIGGCALLFAAVAAALAFLVTPRYRAEVVFSPANNSSQLSALGDQLGGLAAIAGINLGSMGAGQKSEEALAYLRSRALTREFIERHSLMPLLFASKWDAQHSRWRGDPPTIAEGVDRFAHKVRQISEDRRTGIVTLAIIWRDRVAAANWANWLVAEADDALRQRAVSDLTHSIDYLKAEAAHESVVEMQAAISRVMESELKDAMVARTRDAYAFRVLDPAVVRDPKDTDSPNKVLYVAVGAVLGFLFGVIVAANRGRRRTH